MATTDFFMLLDHLKSTSEDSLHSVSDGKCIWTIKIPVLKYLFKITKEQNKYCNILYSFYWHINLQYTGHHVDRVQLCDICTVFCILFCTHSTGVFCKEEQLFAAMSTVQPIHLFHYLWMEAQSLQPEPLTKHHQLGTSSLVCLILQPRFLLGKVYQLFNLSWWTVAGELC